MRISAVLLAELKARAAASPGLEVCGLLLGRAGVIEQADAAVNVAARPEDEFEVDPAALFAALRAERAGRTQLLGCYHSHPNGRTAPSPRDLAAAEPGRVWLILGAGRARLWLARKDGFDEVEMVEE